MTVDPRIERQLPDILDSLYLSGMPAYRDDLLQQVWRTSQRPAWSFLERWLPMADIASRPTIAPRLPSRALGMALIILALLIALAVALVGTRQTKLPAPFGPAANGSITYISGGDVYVGDLVSGSTRLVVGGPEDDWGAGYSPDGTLIAFFRPVDETRLDLYTVRPDGSDLRRITQTPIPNESWANWTPDSRSIATIHKAEYSGDGCAMTFCFMDQLDLFPATGNGSVVTIAKADRMTEFHFRPPDANEILFRAGDDPGNGDPTFSLYVMNADGSNVRPVAEGAVGGDTLDLTSASYSADGQRIFVNRWTSDASGGEPGCCQLYVMNADGSDEHEFIPNDGDAWDGSAVVSPDGTKIAFWHNDKPTHGISVIRADGTGPIVEIGPALANPADYYWSPDSSTILMYPSDGTSPNAYVLDPDGGPWTTLPWASDADIDWQRVAN